MDNTENTYIALCKQRIEKEHNLQTDTLIQRDFEYLNKVIYEKSGVDLSTATLRRIWSDDREGIPQAKTLDAMAQLLGYDGWHEFKKSNPVKLAHSNNISLKRIVQLLIIVVLIIGGLTITRYWGSQQFTVSLLPEKSLHEGVPATIGFNYDISEVSDKEIKIQISWNPYERTVLDPEKDFYTGTYFYPDYHEAKLLLEEEILTSNYVHVTTPGWHGLIMKSGLDTNPIYVASNDFLKSDRLIINSDLSDAYDLDQLDELYSVFTLSNESIGEISGDDFELDVSVKGLGYISNRVCSQTDIVIKGATNSIRIPISNEGCYGVTTLKCGDTFLSGKTNDLSSLSTDLLKSQHIKVTARDRSLTVQVGENEPFKVPYSESIGPLKVIKFIFVGFGALDNFKLSASGEPFENESLTPF